MGRIYDKYIERERSNDKFHPIEKALDNGDVDILYRNIWGQTVELFIPKEYDIKLLESQVNYLNRNKDKILDIILEKTNFMELYNTDTVNQMKDIYEEEHRIPYELTILIFTKEKLLDDLYILDVDIDYYGDKTWELIMSFNPSTTIYGELKGNDIEYTFVRYTDILRCIDIKDSKELS